MRNTSSYGEASYLANKPDITAPGSYMRVVKTTAGTSNFYLNSDGYYPSGTSFAAPIVTGIVAQIQQAGAMGFRTWPGLVKSVLATSADPSKIRNEETSPADMSNVSNDHYLWKKSGAGLVNA
ncbi:S8 family serine peptidase, partial [Vibrio sp. FNV 38]|nr:S8 family serine peptidase [Vibrio sp. FNV 38]